MFAIIVLVSISNLWLLLPTAVMAVLFYGLRYVYVNTARSVKRIEAMSMSDTQSTAPAHAHRMRLSFRLPPPHSAQSDLLARQRNTAGHDHDSRLQSRTHPGR